MTHATLRRKRSPNETNREEIKKQRWNAQELCVLDLAITEEKESHLFYRSISSRAKNPKLKSLFRQLAADELLHKAKLEELRDGTRNYYEHIFGECRLPEGADHELTEPHSEDERALALALRWERASVKLYLDLALSTRSEELHKVLIGLSLDEIKQKHTLILTYIQQAA